MGTQLHGVRVVRDTDWDDGFVVARVMPYLTALDEIGPKLDELFFKRRDERGGDHLMTFKPNPTHERYYWLVVLTDDVERSLQELLYWTLARLDDHGTVVIHGVDPEPARRILERPVRFEDGVRPVGERFVVVQA